MFLLFLTHTKQYSIQWQRDPSRYFNHYKCHTVKAKAHLFVDGYKSGESRDALLPGSFQVLSDPE